MPYIDLFSKWSPSAKMKPRGRSFQPRGRAVGRNPCTQPDRMIDVRLTHMVPNLLSHFLSCGICTGTEEMFRFILRLLAVPGSSVQSDPIGSSWLLAPATLLFTFPSPSIRLDSSRIGNEPKSLEPPGLRMRQHVCVCVRVCVSVCVCMLTCRVARFSHQ